MHQGQASKDGMAGTKVEPQPKAVSPQAVSRIGLQQVYYKKVPVYEGRGLKAPMVSAESLPHGSQGRH